MEHVLVSHSFVFWLLILILAAYFAVIRLFETASTFFPTSDPVAAIELPAADMSSNIDFSWHAPISSNINSLSSAINSTGTYGFIFNSSTLPTGVPYGTYNWCNMPHARATEYPRVNSSYTLEFVEVIHRHHKRTPYASNAFPHEDIPWNCDNGKAFYYGAPVPLAGTNHSANTYWNGYSSPSNPMQPAGYNGTCDFPQITHGGLDDSFQHGKDLYGVYHDLLGFIPETYDPEVTTWRVTNNVITSQVAGMLTGGFYAGLQGQNLPAMIQGATIDSLEPTYSCPAASSNFSSYASGSSAPGWQAHLKAASNLYAQLDAISGVSPTDSGFLMSFDHYFDDLSARLCDGKPLPCSVSDPSKCVTQDMANEVFRLGEYEYSYTYRDAGAQTLEASVGSYGIWVAELAQDIRHVLDPSEVDSVGIKTQNKVKYRHNVAHDGSLSRLLSILQIDKMVWPGMGSEVIFEVYKGVADQKFYVRVLWGGQVLTSSNPTLGHMDMLPAGTLLAYFDGLVGKGASRIPGICQV